MGVIAYHVIITNYGFWLLNDPRVVVGFCSLVGIVSCRRAGDENYVAPFRCRRSA